MTLSFSMSSEVSLDSWVKHQIDLLELERSAETDQLSGKIQTLSAVKAQELGISILHLKVDSSRSTLMGRTSLILRRLDDKPFPSHSFRVGDEALLHSSSGNLKRKNKDEADFVHGVVSKLTLTEITLVTDEVEEDLSPPPLRLDQHASDATYKKMKLALTNLPSLASTTSHPLIKLLFYENEDVPINPIDSSTPLFPLHNKSLNASQIEAIQLALTLPPLALVQGPPGTGKTSTLVELILQLVRSNMRVLVCAPSNIAVDTILQRLHSFSLESSKRNRNREGPFLRMVRLGHPARVHESILQYCLDSLILDDDGTEIVADVRAEMDTILNALSKSRNRSKKAELRSELRSLRKEAKVRESRAVEGILKSRNVVLSTNIGASSRLLKDEAFDVVVIDEAAQALEASCWVPIPLGKSCILFGDHQQLPPTIKSPQAAKAGMDVTLFDRIFRDSKYAPLCRMLNVQYRMNDLISSWASMSSYDGKLVSDGSVASHALSDLLIHPDVFEDEVVSNCPMLLIDTSGCYMHESSGDDCSYANKEEAELVDIYVRRLLSVGLQQEHIGVITPYNGQLEILRSLLNEEHPNLEIKTVDGFQGGEKEVIVISFVRSNKRREVGFLSDERRINVAITRAKRQVVVICDVFTCSSNAFLSTLLDYIAAHGEHISAHDIYLSGATDHSNLANNTVESRSLIQPLLPMTLNIHEAESDVYTDSDSSVKIKSLGLSDEEQALSCGSHSANTLSGLPLATKDDSILSELKTLLCIFASKAISGGRVLISSPSSSDLSSSSSSCHREKKSLISLESVPASIPAPSTCCLDFPPSLTAYQRMALHELCEELGLYHRSINDGELRCLQVSDVPFLLQGEVVEEKLSKDAKSENQRAFPRAIGGENGHPEELAVAASSGKECTTSSSSSKVLKRPTDEGAKISLRQPVGMKKKPIPAKVMESEDDILAAAIAQNQASMSNSKYRISCQAMPNPERAKQADLLRRKLQMAQKIRANDVTNEKEGKKSGGSTTGRK